MRNDGAKRCLATNGHGLQHDPGPPGSALNAVARARSGVAAILAALLGIPAHSSANPSMQLAKEFCQIFNEETDGRCAIEGDRLSISAEAVSQAELAHENIGLKFFAGGGSVAIYRVPSENIMTMCTRFDKHGDVSCSGWAEVKPSD